MPVDKTDERVSMALEECIMRPTLTQPYLTYLSFGSSVANVSARHRLGNLVCILIRRGGPRDSTATVVGSLAFLLNGCSMVLLSAATGTRRRCSLLHTSLPAALLPHSCFIFRSRSHTATKTWLILRRVHGRWTRCNKQCYGA